MLAGPDLLVIMVIALIVFGPKKLPEIGQTIGKAMREFKKASEEARESFEGGLRELEQRKESDVTEKKSSADFAVATSRSLALPDTSLTKKEDGFQQAVPPADKTERREISHG